MAIGPESILSAILLLTSAYLLWVLLRHRQRSSFDGQSNEAIYDGRAREPGTLLEPDDVALEQMGRLLDWGAEQEE